MNEPNLKPSGLRPPSKIGRPCLGTNPKPAVPSTPKTNGTTSSVRKLSEDLMKTKITEETEEEEPYHGFGRRQSYDRKSSIGGLSSNDSLWGDARRLSEAGVRRTSDNSVILTEDTDSFIVGDKVWVGGTKPGRIAFIGETQFASGDWAGIVLEEPIGKNDGSVGGTRYFQCEAKKGVFSRLGRLTRYPLAVPSPPMAPSPSPPPPVSSSTPAAKRATPPPVPRTPPLVSPPSTATNTSSEAKVGDRVIVMSTQGSKIGILRYRGTTGFAPGEWCGVELDDPLGKNDGSVEGIRYFQCQPKYGLFAPAAKVSRSPAPDRRPSCQLHHSSVRRTSSRESLSSMTSKASTVTSTASRKPLPRASTLAPGTPKATPQELLKSKQEQIEKLLKERELDRSRMVRAAEQTEEAEKQLNLLKAEFDLFRVESEKKAEDLLGKIKKLEDEKADLAVQLEDAQFRAEEESINKSDIEDVHAENVNHIKEMEKLLAEEQIKVESLLAELCDLNIARQQVASLKTELEAMKKAKTEYENDLKKELIDTMDRANRMEQNYNELQEKLEGNPQIGEEVSILKEELSKISLSLAERETQNELLKKSEDFYKSTTQKQQQVIDEMQSKLSTVEFKLQEAETYNKLLGEGEQQLKSKCAEMSNLLTQVNQLKDELSEAQKRSHMLQEHNESLKKELSEFTDFSNNKLSDIDRKYCNDIQNLKQTLEEYSYKLSNKEKELSEEKIKVDVHEKENSSIQKELNDLRKNLESHQNSLNDRETEMSGLKKEIDQLKIELATSKETSGTIKDQLSVEIKELTQTLEEANSKITNLCSEKNDILSKTQTEISSLKEQINSFEGNIFDLKEQNDKLKNELAAKNGQIVDVEKHCSDLEVIVKKQVSEMDVKISQLAKLEQEYSELSQKYNQSLESENSFRNQVQTLELEIGDLRRQLNNAVEQSSELQILKQKLENDVSQLMNTSTDSSQQLVNLNSDLIEKQNELSRLKISSAEEIRLHENRVQELEMKLDSFKREGEKAIIEIKERLENSTKNCKNVEEAYSLKCKELEELQKNEETVRNECYNLKKSIDQLQVDVDNYVTQNTSLSKSLEDKENKMKLSENELSTKILVIEDLQKRVLSLENDAMNLLQEKENLEVKNKALISKVYELERTLTAFEENNNELMKQNEALKSSSSEVTLLLNTEMEKMRKMLQDKAKLFEEKEAYLLNQDKTIKEKTEEAEKKIREIMGLSAELQALQKEHLESKQRESEQNEKIRLLESEILELNSNVNCLTKEKESSLNEIKNLDSEIGNLKALVKDQLHFRDELENKKKELEVVVSEKAELEKQSLEKEKCLQDELLKIKDSFEKLSYEYKEKCSSNHKNTDELQEQCSMLKKTIEIINKTHEEKEKNIVSKIKELEELNSNLVKEGILLKDSESSLKSTIEKLNDEVVKVKEMNKITLKELEAIKSDLTGQLKLLEAQLNVALSEKAVQEEKSKQLTTELKDLKSADKVISGEESMTTLLEEKELADTQINFLNSIIVDLQKKNDLLKERLNDLELRTESSSTLNGVKKKKEITPRMFCDICDVFDAHETEDCPQQASTEPVRPVQHHIPGTRGFDRPYCPICEVFGHSTEECDDTETF
nr:restin homolog isoform X2 [Halyomorpha halys]